MFHELSIDNRAELMRLELCTICYTRLHCNSNIMTQGRMKRTTLATLNEFFLTGIN